jgi:hypothetical protein
MPHVNYIAVVVAAVAIFILGGLWYSPVLFAKRWVKLIGKTEEEMKAASPAPAPLMFLAAFVCGFLVSLVLAVLLNHFINMSALRGAEVGAGCWLGFAGATSFANVIFAQKPKELWLIDSGYNLVSFVVAGVILGAWR